MAAVPVQFIHFANHCLWLITFGKQVRSKKTCNFSTKVSSFSSSTTCIQLNRYFLLSSFSGWGPKWALNKLSVKQTSFAAHPPQKSVPEVHPWIDEVSSGKMTHSVNIIFPDETLRTQGLLHKPNEILACPSLLQGERDLAQKSASTENVCKFLLISTEVHTCSYKKTDYAYWLWSEKYNGQQLTRDGPLFSPELALSSCSLLGCGYPSWAGV